MGTRTRSGQPYLAGVPRKGCSGQGLIPEQMWGLERDDFLDDVRSRAREAIRRMAPTPLGSAVPSLSIVTVSPGAHRLIPEWLLSASHTVSIGAATVVSDVTRIGPPTPRPLRADTACGRVSRP